MEKLLEKEEADKLLEEAKHRTKLMLIRAKEKKEQEKVSEEQPQKEKIKIDFSTLYQKAKKSEFNIK